MEQGNKQPALSPRIYYVPYAAVPYHFDGSAGLPLGVVNHFEVDAGLFAIRLYRRIPRCIAHRLALGSPRVIVFICREIWFGA